MVTVTDQRVFDISQLDRSNITQMLPFTTSTAETLLAKHLEKTPIQTKATFMRDRIVFKPSGFRDALFYRDIVQFLKCDTIPGLFMLYTIDENTNEHMFESYKCLYPSEMADIHVLVSVTMNDKYRQLKDAARVVDGTDDLVKPETVYHIQSQYEPTYETVDKSSVDGLEHLRPTLSIISASPSLRKPYPDISDREIYGGFPDASETNSASYPIQIVQQPVVQTQVRPVTLRKPTVMSSLQVQRPIQVQTQRKSLVMVEPKSEVILRRANYPRTTTRSLRQSSYTPSRVQSRLVSLVDHGYVQEAPPRLESMRLGKTTTQHLYNYSPGFNRHHQSDDLILVRKEIIGKNCQEEPLRLSRTRSYERPLSRLNSFAQYRPVKQVAYQVVERQPRTRRIYTTEPQRIPSTYISQQNLQIPAASPTSTIVSQDYVRPVTQVYVPRNELVPNVKTVEYQQTVNLKPTMHTSTKSFIIEQGDHRIRPKSEKVIYLNSPMDSTAPPIQPRSSESLIRVDTNPLSGPAITDRGSYYMYADRKNN